MKKILLATNLLTIALLLMVSIYAGLPQNILKKLRGRSTVSIDAPVSCTYALKNFDYHYKTETDTPDIVMLGNSIVQQGDWTRLLKREDVINRGIAGDQLPCICERLKYLKNIGAKIWFLEGGINDLPEKDPVYLFEQYKKIALFTKAENAIPVINLVFYLSPRAGEKYPGRADYQNINARITELNAMLVNFAKENNITVIDMNKTFSGENHVLKEEFTTDGVHLSETGYKAWSEQISAVLQKFRI